jgi:hypothetical protein
MTSFAATSQYRQSAAATTAWRITASAAAKNIRSRTEVESQLEYFQALMRHAAFALFCFPDAPETLMVSRLSPLRFQQH